MGLPRTNLIKPQLSATAGPLPFQAFTAPAAVTVGERTLREAQAQGATEVDLDRPSRPYPSAISTRELLERAAAIGPARTTWESIVLPPDPILDEKRQPHVAERRERFTRMVKVGLGACLALCVVALGVSALSGDASVTSPQAAAEARNSVPAYGIVPVEKLDPALRAKVTRRSVPPTAAIVRPKRR